MPGFPTGHPGLLFIVLMLEHKESILAWR